MFLLFKYNIQKYLLTIKGFISLSTYKYITFQFLQKNFKKDLGVLKLFCTIVL